jgi:hypothetical protein
MHVAASLVGEVEQRVACRRRWWSLGSILLDQRRDPIDEVAVAIGEILVCAVDEPLLGEIGVAEAGDLDGEPLTERIDAI